MHKPMGASTPPRDLAESARWLAAEQHDSDSRIAFGIIALGAAIVAWVAAVVYALIGLF